MCVGLPVIGGAPQVEATNSSPKPVLPKIGSAPVVPVESSTLPKIGGKK